MNPDPSSTNLAKEKLLVFVAQRPTLDPRVDWIATSAASEFEVIVHGLVFANDTDLDVHQKNGYKIDRHKRVGGTVSLIQYCLLLMSIMPARYRTLGYLLAAAASPLLIVAGLVRAGIKFAKTAVKSIFRSIGKWRQALFARLALTAPLTVDFIHLHTMMSQHFAPATSAFLSAIEKSGARPAVVHCCDLDTLMVGVIAKRQYGCTVVYDAHEYWPYTDPALSRRVIACYRTLEQILIRHADHVVTVNPLLAQAMQRDYALDIVHSIPNAAPWNTGGIAASAGIITKLAAGRVSFLYQGGIAPERGLEELLVAWRHIDPSKAALFIRAPESVYKDALLLWAADAALLGDSVHFLAPVTEDDLIPAAREADVGLIPYKNTLINHRLACPNKLSQYMHAGLMLISSDVPYVAGIIRDARAGLSFDSNSKDGLVAALNSAIADPERLAECKRNALAYAREKFNWNVFYPTLRQLYDPALKPATDNSDTTAVRAHTQKASL